MTLSQAFEYQNQPQVGQAVNSAISSGIANRSSIFITTKINTKSADVCSQAGALAAVKVDIQQLGVAQVDLVLQHFPCETEELNGEVWAGLVQAKNLGLTRSIGVSHFNKADIQGILSLNSGVCVHFVWVSAW